MGTLLASAYQPFVVAALVLLTLVAIEVATMLAGFSLTDAVEAAMGGKEPGEGGLGHGLDWLNIGRVPLLILIFVALASFSVAGFLIQAAASAVAAPLPGLVAAIAALVAAVPLARGGSRLVGRLIPRDETYAVADEDFIGRTGVVTLGPVKAGGVARLKLQDQHGNWHFPRARPAEAGEEIPEGAAVLVVDRVGRELAVIRAQEALAPQAEGRAAPEA